MWVCVCFPRAQLRPLLRLHRRPNLDADRVADAAKVLDVPTPRSKHRSSTCLTIWLRTPRKDSARPPSSWRVRSPIQTMCADRL